MRKIFKKITALVLTAAVAISAECGGVRIHGVSPDVKISKAAETQGRYVSDIRVSHTATKEEAEKELGEDYTVLDKDFNEGMSSHSWIGYSTTDDADLAVTDLRVMGMDGDYSESDYKTLLDNHKTAIEGQLDVVIPAIIEYTKNYDAGTDTAADIHKLLNTFYEDDTDKNMGDLLLELGRIFINDRNDTAARETLSRIFVEGSNAVIVSIENLLTKASDTKVVKKGSWLTRMSVLGPDGLDAIYKQAYPGKTKSYRKNMMENDFGEDAGGFLTELEKFREIIKEAENSELAGAADDEAAVSEMVSEVTDVDIEEVPVTSDIDTLMDTMYQGAENSADAIELVDQMTGMTIISLLKDTSFGTKTMYDFFMDEGLQKSDLYTLAYVLSDGQKSIIDDLGIYAVFESALTQYSEEQGESGKSDIDISGMEEGLISVYEGVDRSVFDGDTAITADTLKNMETRQVEDVLTPNDNGSVVLLTCAAIVGAVCTGLAIWGFGSRVVTSKEVSSVVKTMQANLNLMKTCDEAWKLNILETRYKISRFTKSKATLSSIVEAGGDTTAMVKNAYKEATETMRSFGAAEKSVMDTIDAYGERQKATHIESYKRSINDLKTSGEYYTTNKVKVPRVSWGARVLLVLGAAAAFAFAGYEIYCMTKKHTVEFTHIPANMVYKTTEGDVYYMTYHAATDASGNVTDIHDKKGNGWQVIYTTTDSNAGDPILVSSLIVSDRDISSDPDVEYLLDFDSSAPSDLADRKYTGKGTTSAFISYMTGTEEPEEVADTSEETEVSTEETKETAAPTAVETAAPSGEEAPNETSVFAWPGMLWILLVILVIAGGAAGAGVYYRKRKK